MGISDNKNKKYKSSAAVRIICVLKKATFIALILLVAVLLITVVKSRISQKTPSVLGYQLFNVLSHSMDGYKKDSFAIGSLVLVKAINPEDIKVGDIITYDRKSEDSKLTTHRVVEINMEENGELSFTTKGDTNPSPDGTPVPEDIVLGKVIGSAPFLGYAVSFAQTRNGIIFLIFVSAGLIVIVKTFNNITSIKNIRKKSEDAFSKSEFNQ